MYLIDTNIILEVLLWHEKAEEVTQFFEKFPHHNLYITDFSLFSIGLILLRRKQHDVYIKLINDILIDGGLQLVHLSIEDLKKVVEISQKFNIDFDDAYQYTAAEKHNLTIISFDSDFDRTERKRKTPAEV
ncbi:MAG: PIN domain-containing protein [Thermodesulfovibrionales bacterium]